MEAERDQITAIMQSPDYYRNPKSDPADDQASLEKLEKKIAISYSQWEELEAIADWCFNFSLKFPFNGEFKYDCYKPFNYKVFHFL